MNRDATFYFANLGADIVRCVHASDDPARYEAAFGRASRTLDELKRSGRAAAYEEGLLLTSALEYARSEGRLTRFESDVNHLIEPFARRIVPSAS